MFDSAAELLAKIRLGEDSALELKQITLRGGRVSAPRRDSLADEIAAIANSASAVLLLGVNDESREIIGIPVEHLDAVERYLFEICNDSITPPVAFRAYRIELPGADGQPHAVLKVEIDRSLHVHKSPGGYFRRQGSAKREMPPQVLARLFQQRSQARIVYFDEQPVPETGLADLDPQLYERLISRAPGDVQERLLKRKILTHNADGAVRCTVAGLLTCSRHPQDALRGAFIQAVRYRGTRQDSNTQVAARTINGPLHHQIRDAMEFVRGNMAIWAVKAPERVETPQFSARAVFEAVVNAVAHRDYSIYGSKIRLFIFDDRLELYSPGALPNTITIDSLPMRQSTRNELITTILAERPVDRLNQQLGRGFFMEKRGDGVPIIFAESERLSGKTPSYQVIDDAELVLTIWGAKPTGADDA